MVKREQDPTNRVKNTVQFEKPMSVMKAVSKETVKRIWNKTVGAGMAVLTTTAMSAPTFTAPAQAQLQPNVQALAKKLESEYINLLTAPEYSGKTIMTRQPVTDSIHELHTSSHYLFTFIAGPGPITVDILKRPSNHSSANVSYFGEGLKCSDFLGVNYINRGDCYLRRQQPVLMRMTFSHDRGKQQAFKFRVKGYSGIISPQEAEEMVILKDKNKANARPYRGNLTPRYKRFCSIANGRCW